MLPLDRITTALETRNYKNSWEALKTQIPYIPRLIKLIWSASPRLMILSLGMIVLDSLIPIVSINLSRIMVNDIAEFIETNNGILLNKLIFFGAVYGSLLVSEHVLKSIKSLINLRQNHRITEKISALIIQKCIEMDLSFYESKSGYDLLSRAVSDSTNINTFINILKTMLTKTFILLGLFAIVISYSPWIIVILLLGSIPSFWINLRFSKLLRDWFLSRTLSERIRRYYKSLTHSRDSVLDMKVFGLGKHYATLYNNLNKQLNHEQYIIQSKLTLANLATTVIPFFSSGLIVVWLGRRVLAGKANYGDIAVFYQVLNRAQLTTTNLTTQFTQFYKNLLFIENFFYFIDFESETKIVDAPTREMISMPLNKSIRFENISFSYPESNRSVVQNFNWHIPAGKTIALVGENGQGKTSMIKLLSRLFEPQEGNIFWDDVNIRELPLKEVYHAVAFMSQFPFRFNTTIRENILLGDLDFVPSDETIDQVMQLVGLDEEIARMPHGYDTMLGKEFGGEDLSGGQWQRLALARVLVRHASILIFDEPTSSMDSWSAIKWIKNLRTMIKDGQTVLVITHSFSIARQADVICVMQNNQITEQGTHEELIELNGHYAHSWNAQTLGIDLRKPSTIGIYTCVVDRYHHSFPLK